MKKRARPLIHEFKRSEKYIALSDLLYMEKYKKLI